ncbi:hypothetical protein [Vibrio alfacsensis]|uniref:hypothetical protein n=1 Tax=Vibrio alfacsensis TaxID=1074311 RepID=UPI004067844D
MNYIEIADERYDVIAALQEKPALAVDKELILLINRYPQDATRRIDWVLAEEFNSPDPRLKGELRSDGEMIKVQITRF